MNLQTLISLLVWAAVICFTRVVSSMNELQKSKLADQLNVLLSHPGWRFMDDVKIWQSSTYNNIKYEGFEDPMSVIFEVMSSNRKPVDEQNVLQRYDQIWTVLRCKYAEIIEKWRLLIQHLMGVCRQEKKEDKNTADCSHQRYFNCFHLLLTKIDIMSPRFKWMSDALEFFYSMGPQSQPKKNLMAVTKMLAEYTLPFMSTTLSKLSEHGFDEKVIDLELQNISRYIFVDIIRSKMRRFVSHYCDLPALKEWSTANFINEFDDKLGKNLVPRETTMLQYIEDEIDSFVGKIFGSLFYNLGFVYNEDEIVTIRTN